MTTRHRSGASDRRYVRLVRTTLQIDDDVLEAARCIAADEHVSVGEILSRLARRGLEPRPDEPAWARLYGLSPDPDLRNLTNTGSLRQRRIPTARQR